MSAGPTANEPHNVGTPSAKEPSVEELREDIAHTREDLGATLSELSARADVPARAKAKVSSTASAVRQKAPEPVRHALDASAPVVAKARPYGKHIAAVLAAGAAVRYVIRRRRRS